MNCFKQLFSWSYWYFGDLRIEFYILMWKEKNISMAGEEVLIKLAIHYFLKYY